MSETHGTKAKDRSPVWLLFLTGIGGVLLGQVGGTTNAPSVPTKPLKSAEQSAPDADAEPVGGSTSADDARYDRLNAPYYGFLGIDPSGPKAVGAKPKLPRRAVQRSVGWLEFLIVTVTDPIDTHLSYRFDQQIETLHRAFAAEGYVIDRFYLPWEKENKHDRHLTEPGLLLYRNQRPDTNHEGPIDKTDLLAVYLVGETPTGGIQTGAFRFAVRHINGIAKQVKSRRGAKHQDELMVCGPTFSGAADSLARAISDCCQEPSTITGAGRSVRPKFRVITGSAISVNRDRFLQLAGADPATVGGNRVSIHATVASNRQLSDALIQYVTNSATRAKPLRIAWLTESGTGYGAATSLSFDNKQKSRESHSVKITKFQFPVNIARVRAAYQEERQRLQSTRSTLGPNHYRLPIPFNDDSPTLDLPPMQTPNMTSPSAELVIGQILTTIRNEGIEYVGISASDIRDPVFLTELIKEQAPDAQILLITSDLLHLHSEYLATMHGSLVASSYSLCPEDQDWCFPFEGRHNKVVLSNQNLYGLFNAVAFLRGLQRGDLKFDHAETLLVLDNDWHAVGAKPLAYGMPLLGVDDPTSEFAPPVWISMIGSTGIWPLKCNLPEKSQNGLNALGLVVPRELWNGAHAESKRPSGDEQLPAAPKLLEPSFDGRIAPSSKFLMWFWVCLALVYLWNVLRYSTSSWASPLDFHRRTADESTQKYLWPRRCFRAMTTLALLVAVTLGGSLALIPLWIGEARLDRLDWWLTSCLCALAGAAATGLAGVLFVDIFWFAANDAWVLVGKKLRCAPDSKRGRKLEALFVFVVGLAVVAIAAFKLPSAVEARVPAMLFFLTWSDIWNGISLFLPVQLLVGAVALLSHGMLLQMDLLSGNDPNRGDNLVPRPAWRPKKDFIDPATKKIEVRKVVWQILYPIATRFRRHKSIVLSISALLVCGSWLISLFLRTDFTGPLDAYICGVFILACGYWGVRFVKTLEICHALARELRTFLKALEPRERYAVEHWRGIVGRLGPARKIGLRMFWQHRPHWDPERGDLAQAYRRFTKSPQDDEVDISEMIESQENFYAMHVELYVRQMFVHLVALVTGLVVTGGLLFLTAQCFPLNSEPLLQLSTTVMLVALAILILWYYMHFDRDELLSVFDGTEPNEVEWNWSMLRTTVPALALGMFGLISQTFPEMWIWLHSILQPLAHSTG